MYNMENNNSIVRGKNQNNVYCVESVKLCKPCKT